MTFHTQMSLVGLFCFETRQKIIVIV